MIAVRETTGVLPPQTEAGIALDDDDELSDDDSQMEMLSAEMPVMAAPASRMRGGSSDVQYKLARAAPSSMAVQTRATCLVG